MAVFTFVLGLAAAPLVLFLAILASPAWIGVFWIAAALALFLLLVVGANRFAEKRGTRWFVGLGAMVIVLVAIGLVSPGAAPLLVWPVVVAAVAAVVIGIADAFKPQRA